MKETLFTQGVVVPIEEYPIYFNQQNGAFSKFFVKKGEVVSVGSELFEYIPINRDLEIIRLETEITELESLADSTDAAINQLEQLLTRAKSEQKDDEPELASTYWIETNIYKKEQEWEAIAAKINKLQEQLQRLQEASNHVVVNSEFDGYVKEIRHDLTDPIMTISSNVPSIKGSLNESELTKVQQGMKVSISVQPNEEPVIGAVSEVSPLPSGNPGIDEESTYSFNIQVGNPTDSLFVGKHVGVDIILNESIGALTIPVTSLSKKKDFVYLLTSSGIVEKRAVQTGISNNGKLEIVSGINNDDIVITNYAEVEYGSESSFRTPIQMNKLSKSNLKESLKSEWKYIVKGFLERY